MEIAKNGKPMIVNEETFAFVETPKLTIRNLVFEVLSQKAALWCAMLLSGVDAVCQLSTIFLKDFYNSFFPGFDSILNLLDIVVVTYFSVVVKNYAIKRCGFTKIRYDSTLRIVLHKIKFVLPAIAIIFILLLISSVPYAIYVINDHGARSSVWLNISLSILAVLSAPIVVRYYFVGEVAQFGLTILNREALASSLHFFKANRKILYVVYFLEFGLLGLIGQFMSDNVLVNLVLQLFQFLVDSFLMVGWTLFFGKSLIITRKETNLDDGVKA